MFLQARWKLTAWYAAALASILLLVGTATYLSVRRSLDDDVRSAIKTAMADLAAFDPSHYTPLRENHRERDDDDDEREQPAPGDGSSEVVSNEVFFVTTDRNGAVLLNPRGVDLEHIDFTALVARADSGNSWNDVRGEDSRYRFASNATTATVAGEPVYLHVGQSLRNRDSALSSLWKVLAFGGLGGIGLACVGGFLLAGRALKPIQASLESQRRFVSDASHELRTPIAVVQANNELLIRHPEQTVEQNAGQVEAIAAETEHMARLVGDLLTLARADEGRVQLAREAVDLGELVTDVARDMKALAEAKGVSLEVAARPAIVEGDSQRLRQLALILVDNAVKYTQGGGTVSITTRKAGRRAEMVVTDTGVGIPGEHQGRIFDRFYRVDAARGPGAAGTGLGLAIAKWIAEVHGGRIAMQSEPGRGTTFTVRLPAVG
ncbi:MAG: HAMP domain-containing histidine kinase [Chloroflexi bacterium]|nr:HAMP domain-containing histidine kinase [Chloroflexota bacterium]